MARLRRYSLNRAAFLKPTWVVPSVSGSIEGNDGVPDETSEVFGDVRN